MFNIYAIAVLVGNRYASLIYYIVDEFIIVQTFIIVINCEILFT